MISLKYKRQIQGRVCQGIVESNPDNEICIECECKLQPGDLIYQIDDPQYLHVTCEKAFTDTICFILKPVLDEKLTIKSRKALTITQYILAKYPDALAIFKLLLDKYHPGFREQVKAQLKS